MSDGSSLRPADVHSPAAWRLAMADRAWFRPLPDELVERALASGAGRVQLWRHLLRSGELAGLQRPRRADAPLSGPAALPAPALDELALDLGALACAGAIRTLVDRASVLALRAALGDGRYESALKHRAHAEGRDAEAAHALKSALADEQALRRIVRDRGACELIVWLRSSDPWSADMLALRFAPGTAPAGASAWLDADAVVQRVDGQAREASP